MGHSHAISRNSSHESLVECSVDLCNVGVDASKKLSMYPGLIDSDVGWMRNSASHASWEYIPKTDSITMWDSNTPRTEISSKELQEKVHRMYTISGPVLLYVYQIFHIRDYLVGSGMIEEFRKAFHAIGSSTPSLEKVTNEMPVQFMEQFKLLRAMVEQNAPDVNIWPITY